MYQDKLPISRQKPGNTIKIAIPEENPFFPYEVQFTCGGEVESQWFMTPDDSVEVGGHTFYVDAYIDGTVATQASMEVGGDTVVIYPQEKEFTDGDGEMELSLLPLKTENFTVDLRGYTPVELTRVQFKTLFGDRVVDDVPILWNYSSNSYNADYEIEIEGTGTIIDLSYNTYSAAWGYDPATGQYGEQDFSSNVLHVIAGNPDQLDSENTRYNITMQYTVSKNWFIPTVAQVSDDGTRQEIAVVESSTGYQDYSRYNRQQSIYVDYKAVDRAKSVYICLSVNEELYANPKYGSIRVYEGSITDEAELSEDKEITGKILGQNVTEADAGYEIENNAYYNNITIVSYDAENKITGLLPVSLYLGTTGQLWLSYDGLYEKNGENYSRVDRYPSVKYANEDGFSVQTYDSIQLYDGKAVDGEYYARFTANGESDTSKVTAAYVGLYHSITEAKEAGAEEVHEALFGDGYAADYSERVTFSVFVGEDDTEDGNGETGNTQSRFYYSLKTVERVKSSETSLSFNGLYNESGYMEHYIIRYDSYVNYPAYAGNYQTILVGGETDLTKLIPSFYVSSGAKVYTRDTNGTWSEKEEVSRESVHDFTEPVAYKVVAENGENEAIYWLQVIKPTEAEGAGQIYISGMVDKEGKYIKPAADGVTYSDREVLMGRSGNSHDILIANMGEKALEKLSVTLEDGAEDVLELDEYWTLKGEKNLEGFSTLTAAYGNDEEGKTGELPNMALIRLRCKNEAASAEISGKLRIQADGKDLVVLDLTGLATTLIAPDTLPDAAVGESYSQKLSNNDRYEGDVSYRVQYGNLPEGMELDTDGTISGTPAREGRFSFNVYMEITYKDGRSFNTSKYYSLSVTAQTATPEPVKPTERPSATATPEPVKPTEEPSATATPEPVKPTEEPSATATPEPVKPTERPTETPKPELPSLTPSEDGKYYFYEDGVMAVSKEAYVDGQWRWFDEDGTMAVDKDVYQYSNGGKWVRYDENGAMVKGEDFRYGGWYYFEAVTGAMVKGPVILEDGRRVFYDTITGQMLKGEQKIDGRTYRFDEVDGHLIDGKDTCFWVHIDGKDYWYEDWVRQGWKPEDPSYRGKEIYDPESDAWYWLDNVQNGAKAVSKDVYQESLSAYPDKEDGTGKWVRYDAEGRMVKGWDTTSAGTYYFEIITGAMAKGNVTIDDVQYQFDWITGIMQ